MSASAVVVSQGIVTGSGSFTLALTPYAKEIPAMEAFLAGCKTKRRVFAFTATWPFLFDTLIADKAAGRDSKAIFDSSQLVQIHSEMPQFIRLKAGGLKAGVDYVIGTTYTKRIVHAKGIVQDTQQIYLGSLNFTTMAFSEINTLIFLSSFSAAEMLETQFQAAWDWIIANDPQPAALI